MSDFAMIRYLTVRGWKMVDNELFTFDGRTEHPVDLAMAAFIQRQMDRKIYHVPAALLGSAIIPSVAGFAAE